MQSLWQWISSQSHLENVGLSVRLVLKCLGGWAGAGCLHALVPHQPEHVLLKGRRGGTAIPNFPSTRQRKIWIAKDRILTFGANLTKNASEQGLCAATPMQLPWCLEAWSIVNYLQPESLKAVFQCLSPRSSAPIQGDFLSRWYFPDKLTKDMFNFFF